MSFQRPFRAVPIREGRKYRVQRLRRDSAHKRRQLWVLAPWVVSAMGVGVLIGLFITPSADGQRSIGSAWFHKLAGTQGMLDGEGRFAPVYYRYCSQARAAGAAPLHRGEPGYRDGLDADGDGVACEPFPRTSRS